MAITLNTASISTGQTIEAGHVTQSAVAFTGGEAYDITISGSLTTTGTNIMSSSASPSITSILTENDSHPFITGIDTTGPNFRMNLADADTSGSAYMALGRQTGNFGGTGFTAQYATGSNASQGEIVMSIGKNGQIGSIQNRFVVQSEPGPIGSNTTSELTLAAGDSTENRRVVQGLVQNGTGDYAEFVAGNQDATPGFKKHVLMQFGFNNTSSIAGFSSSSLNTGSTARNFNPNAVPFGIVAGNFSSATGDRDTVFFIDQGFLGQTTPVTASFQISREGSIDMEGHITASGNISASGHLAINDIHATNFRLMDPLDVTAGPFPMIKTAGALVASTGKIFIGDSEEADTGTHILIDPPSENVIFKNTDAIITGSLTITSQATHALLVLGNISSSGNLEGSNINATNAITASGHGLFQAGKPITTHTSNLSASLSEAGFYHIVGGNLTCSISTSTAPIGAEYEFFQTSSAGNFLFETGSGITLISKNDSLRLAQLGSSTVLKKVATDTFHLMGDLT